MWNSVCQRSHAVAGSINKKCNEKFNIKDRSVEQWKCYWAKTNLTGPQTAFQAMDLENVAGAIHSHYGPQKLQEY